MKVTRYIILLFVVFIIVAIGIRVLIHPSDNSGGIIIPMVNLNQKDFIHNEKIITYEIENIKSITSANNFSTPVFSPNGKNLAYSSLNFKGISLTNLEDRTVKLLTDDEGAGFRFSWSPDSKAITYFSRKIIDGKAVNTIKVVEIESGKIFELTIPGIGASMPSFTQSNEIIYSFKGKLIKRKWSEGNIGNEEIIAENIPANIIIPSHKGDKFIIENDEGIKIMDSNGNNEKIVIKNGLNEFAHMAKVSLSDDKILFFNNIGSITHMFIYDIKSEKTKDLGKGYFGQWLPDGNVIYCLIEDDGIKNTSSDIYVLKNDGSTEKITDTNDQIEIYPMVASDGKFITYLEEKSGKIYYGELKSKN